MKKTFTLVALLVSVFAFAAEAQTSTEAEIRKFYDGYADDLRRHRTEAIANRYDARGYFALGNGTKRFVKFEDNKKQYTTAWTGPKSFDWRDMSFEVLSSDAVAVAGLFDWTGASGVTDTGSYTAVVTKQAGQWRIRIEDESFNTTGFSTKVISGDRMTPGPYKYAVTAAAGSSIGAHRHPQDVRITVRSGRMFVLMGDLETAKVKRLDVGATLLIPANTWHVEWWEETTVAEADTTAPTRTERATPATPRVP